MGNAPTKKDHILVSYKYQLRKDPITFKLYDDFPYPKKLKNVDIETQFQEILKKCILTNEQKEQLNSMTFDVKWKLICKHRFMILTGLCDYRQARKSISMYYAESIKNSNSMIDLDRFFAWMLKEAKEPDINSFLNYGGLDILIDLLVKAEICSRSTKNYTKQILILKILNYLCRFPQIVDKLTYMSGSAGKIFLNFNLHNWEISKYALQLLNDYTWKSEKGQKDALEALNLYKAEHNLKYRFEPFMEILSVSKNIIMLESVLAFINALIESPEEDEKRALLRSEVQACGIKTIIGAIKEKINNEEYKIEDCNYKTYLEECQETYDKETNDQNPTIDGHNASKTTIYFGDNEEDLFGKKQASVLKQIEIFENGFLEFLGGLDDESDNSESFTSFNQEYEKKNEENKDGNEERKDAKSLKSLKFSDKIKGNDVDFTDINQLFNRTRTKSLENENYDDFLAIMQHFCLIPSNENGKKIWKKMREALDEINGLGKDEKLLNLSKFKKMLENKDTIEDLQNKVIFLNTQLRIRDDEIKQLHYKIKEAEFAKQMYKNTNEQIISNFLKEKEINKNLNQKILENEVRNAKLIKDRDDRIKRYDEKIKDLSRNLSYSSTSKSMQPSKDRKNASEYNISTLELENMTLKQELINLKRNSNKSNGFNAKTENKNKTSIKLEKQYSENLSNLPLRVIPEKDELNINSEQSLKLSSCSFNSTAVQTDSVSIEKEEEQEENKTNLEILPSFNKNLSNINDILSNSKDNPIGELLLKSMSNIKNEVWANLNSHNISNLEESGIVLHKHTGFQKNKDQIIEMLTKRIKELENMINNIPNRSSEKNDKSPKSILKNCETDFTGRHKTSSINNTSFKSIQFKFDENDSTYPKIKIEGNSDTIKEDDNEIRTSVLDSMPRKYSIVITNDQLLNEEKGIDGQNKKNIFTPPPPLLLIPPSPNFLTLLTPKNEGPMKEKKSPRVPMKQICWTAVNPNNITNTVWEIINENDVKYDIEEIESQFTSKRPDKKLEPKTSVQIAKVTLLSMNRSKNISIALSKLKLSLSAISEAAIKMDLYVLNLNVIGSLLEACPKEEEINLVTNYDGDKSLLELPEQFVLEIKNVPGFKVRLEALQFYLTYKELVEDFSLKTDKLTDLFENILENEKLYLLLKYTLALGNYFNGSGTRGGAFGFKLDAFDKIVDMKSIDGKKTFLSYIIELIEKNTESSFIDSNEDLKIYEIGRKLPISQLECDLTDIKKGMNLLVEAMKTKSDNPFDNVEYFFNDFMIVLKTNIVEFDNIMSMLQDLYKKICGFYCEDPIETSSDTFVEKIFKIWTACKKAKTANVKEKELLKKEEIRLKKLEEKSKARDNNSHKLECPEDLANYIQTRRMIRRKPDFEGRKYGSILKNRMSVRINENQINELTKKENN